jgi:hypothetical protein
MPYRTLILLAFLSWSIGPLWAQVPNQVVPVTAQVSSSPPSIHLSWPAEPSAQFHKVRRRAYPGGSWQDMALLPGTANGFTDPDVQLGERWEYAVSRSASLAMVDTLCIPPGSNLTFTIHDSGGNGLCCWNSAGSWQLHACGSLIAEGAEYGFQDQHQFIMCGDQECEDLVVRVLPDHDFEEVSWELTWENGTLIAYANGYMAPQFGYVVSGVEVPALEQRGTLLLLVDQTHAAPLEQELMRLHEDLVGEGWLVVQEQIAPGTAVAEVKQVVLEAAAEHADLSALFLIGHIPVPYSGVIAPDGHEDHLGAWPADLYYAELDGLWTDDAVTWQPGAVGVRNHNIPGDGRLDQGILPSDVDLIMGRVDLHDLPVFAASELELLRAYLDRDHAFRTGQLSFSRTAVVDDNFPGLDHGAAVHRSCIPMFGPGQVLQGPFIDELTAAPHLWSMAGGPGSYTSALGVGTSADMASSPLNGAFAHLVGSYFGDWDVTNNFMRSVLASGSMLGVLWGLQETVLHHMGLGFPIGESVRHTQNSSYSEYERHGRSTHVALMGDPTLPLLPMRRVEILSLANSQEGVVLNWTPVEDPDLLGYHLYRRSSVTAHFQRITEAPLQSTELLDMGAPAGQVQYMVRPLKLEVTASGSFHVLGTGRLGTITVTTGLAEDMGRPPAVIHPVPNDGSFQVTWEAMDGITDLLLLDLTGKSVPAIWERSGHEIRIRTDAVAGTYVLQLNGAQGSVLRKPVMIVR